VDLFDPARSSGLTHSSLLEEPGTPGNGAARRNGALVSKA
jgi:hypothetical protein